MSNSTSFRKKILLLTQRFPPSEGGMSVSCARQVEGLRKNNFLVDVFVFSPIQKGHGERRIDRDGGTDWFFGLDGNHGYSAQRAWLQASQENLDIPYDWVVGYGVNFPGFLAGIYATWLSKPSLVMIRGNDFDRDFFDPRLGYWVSESLKRADFIGAVSLEATRRVLKLYPGKRVKWIPNGVHFDELELLPKDRELRDRLRSTISAAEKPIVGIFGELKDKKGVLDWLAALRRSGLLERICLLLVGRADPDTTQILQDPFLTPHILKFDFCPREEIFGYYSACDFFWHPIAI